MIDVPLFIYSIEFRHSTRGDIQFEFERECTLHTNK